MPSLILFALAAPILIPLYHFYSHATVLGVFRSSEGLPSIRSANALIQEKFKLHGIKGSEDMAIHPPTGKIVFVGQQRLESRYDWFPPGGVCVDAAAGAVEKGEMWLVDPTDWRPVSLPILNYDGPLITHGFGLYTPSGAEGESSTYAHVINHVAHREVATRQGDTCGSDEHPAADSRVEIFKLDLDPASSSFGATHVRTVSHPLIRTPNDVLSLGPGEFMVTNDHKRRSGTLRDLEDIVTWRRWSHGNLVHVTAPLELGGEVKARIVMNGIHNANGLGPGMTPDETLLVDASGGMLHVLHRSQASEGAQIVQLNDSVQLPNTLDNPFVLSDPYVDPDSDISCYVLGGLLKGSELGPTWRDREAVHPWSVHIVRKKSDGKGWDKLKILQDDGHFVNALASALLVPIPPVKGENGELRREAWVVLTSFFAAKVGVVRVDLTEWGRR